MPVHPANSANAANALNAASLAPSGKADGARGLRGAGHEHASGDDAPHAFGHQLDTAMQRKNDHLPPAPGCKPQASEHPHAATPAMPAHKADQPEDDEAAATTEAGQLEGGLQAFVNSLPTPATVPAIAATTGTAAQGAADAAIAVAATDADADAIAALAAGGNDARAARASGLDDKQTARARGHAAPELAAGDGDAGIEADAEHGGMPNAHASSRSQEIAAARLAPALGGSAPEAQAGRSLAQDGLTLEASAGTGSNGGNGLLQAAAATAGMPGANAATAASNAAAAQAGHVAPYMGTPHWPDALGQQVLWIAQNDQQVASLTMNPPDLGPVRVTLTVADGQASAAFVSLQPEVRQAIQDAVPRLKEMFADAGLQLQQASVDSGDAGRHSAARTQHGHGFGRAGRDGAADASDESGNLVDAATARTARSMAASRLVDLFA